MVSSPTGSQGRGGGGLPASHLGECMGKAQAKGMEGPLHPSPIANWHNNKPGSSSSSSRTRLPACLPHTFVSAHTSGT